MKEILTTMTKRGQITVPADVRRVLGLKAKDKVAFAIEDDRVELRPVQFTLETAFGSVKPATKTEDLKSIAWVAHEEKVKRELEKLTHS